jgi:Amt family ammonium transporter
MSGVGLASGAVAGLVAVTPAAGFVTPLSAIFLGALAGLASLSAVRLRPRLGLDDSLDVFAVHGVAATLGALLTGVLATRP